MLKPARREQSRAVKFVEDVIRDVSELPDRTSPQDDSTMMLVSADELRSILIAQLRGLGVEVVLEQIVADEMPAGHA